MRRALLRRERYGDASALRVSRNGQNDDRSYTCLPLRLTPRRPVLAHPLTDRFALRGAHWISATTALGAILVGAVGLCGGWTSAPRSIDAGKRSSKFLNFCEQFTYSSLCACTGDGRSCLKACVSIVCSHQSTPIWRRWTTSTSIPLRSPKLASSDRATRHESTQRAIGQCSGSLFRHWCFRPTLRTL